MGIDEKVATEIYNEIIIDLMKDYKQYLDSNPDNQNAFIKEFYQSLSNDKKAQFIQFLDGFAMDIVSKILGGFDGSTKLGQFFGGFSVLYEGEEITPYLQDNFLGLYEEDYSQKTRQKF